MSERFDVMGTIQNFLGTKQDLLVPIYATTTKTETWARLRSCWQRSQE